MSHPELPYLAAGGIAIVGATIGDGKLPPLGRPILGMVAIVVVASLSGGTKLEPLVRQFGILVVIATVIATVNYVRKSRSAA